MTLFDAIADALEQGVSQQDWQRIFNATRDRLLSTEFDGEDTRSNRAVCESIIANALLDVRDARAKPSMRENL